MRGRGRSIIGAFARDENKVLTVTGWDLVFYVILQIDKLYNRLTDQ